MNEQTREKTSEKKSFYFKDPFADLAFLHTLTLHGFKGSEIGECYYAASLIDEGDPQSWREAWNSLAEKIEEIGRLAQAKGHRVSARQAYLRAVTYYRNAAMALRPADPSFQTAIKQYRALFQRFVALSDPPIEVVEIPYEGKALAGYFLRPDASVSKRPTIICGDNMSEELYYWVGPPAVERGYNALLVDLPGIGLNAFNGIGFRADTEVPVGAVIDYLSARSDVDPARIAVYGGGEPGGYIMTRAATYEKRIAACVVDPLVSAMEPIVPLFTGHVLHASGEKETLGSIYAEVFPLMWGIVDPSQAPLVFRNMKADPRLITCPTLCLNDAHDYPELLEQAREAVSMRANKGTLSHLFTPEDGSSYRQLDNFGLKHRVMFDWLDEIFDYQGK